MNDAIANIGSRHPRAAGIQGLAIQFLKCMRWKQKLDPRCARMT